MRKLTPEEVAESILPSDGLLGELAQTRRRLIAGIQRDLDTEQAKPTASEAIYSFLGWITARPEAVTFGAHHNAAIAAELADFFCKHQGWPEPRTFETDGKIWPGNVKTYPTQEEWEARKK